MKKFVSEFVQYPFYSNIIIAVIVLAGLISYLTMKKSFFPERTSRFISVSVAYPGASPKEMEEGITTRIEEAIRGLVGIKEINSTSSENFATVSIETTGEYDLDETLTEVKNAVDGISSFPVDAEKPTVFKRRNTTNAARLGLAGDVDLLTLKKYAQEIEKDFLSSGVMSQVNVNGYPEVEISAEVKEEDLLRYKLTIDEISSAIRNNNRDISAGMIKSENEEILIRARNRSVDPDKIGEIILRANDDGSKLRIRDIANVKLKFADVSNNTLINGKQGIFISVDKLAEEDLDKITEWIDVYVGKFNSSHEGIELAVTFDFSRMLQSRLELLYNNGSLGLLLVVICLAFFLSTRVSFWVAIGIPISFLAMFIVANMMGATINMISLFGMILVIGILVDDGIVIAENIFTHFEMGKSPKKAAIDGALEVMPAVFTSVTTTIVAFTPLLLITGQMEMMGEMALVVVLSLAFSLVEAFFILPAHLASRSVLRPRSENPKHIRAKLDKVLFLIRDKFYARILKDVIQWRWIVVFVPIALMIITAGMFSGQLIRTTFFPAITFDFFNVNVAFTPGSGEKQTNEFLLGFEKAIWEVNDDLMEEFSDSAYITYTFNSIGSSFNGQESGSHAGNIFVMLRDMEGASVSSFDIVSRVREKIGSVPEAQKYTVGGINRWGSPVSISLLSQNLEELEFAKKLMETKLNDFPDLKNITDNNAEGKQEIRLKLKPQAYFLGLTQNDITKQIRQGFYGDQVQKLQQGKDEIRVWVRYPKNDRLTLGQLENIKIKTAKGNFPLTELADYDIERGPVSIKRFNGQREVRVDADLMDPYASVPPIISRIENEIISEIKANYPGVDILYQGQSRSSSESVEEISKYFGIAFLVIILILMIHFKSFFHMLFVISMIPLSFLGVFWGHGLHGHPVSILSAWGMVALSGVVINDAVVFLSKYNSLLVEGYKVADAAFKAGISRFRAILLTTLTTTLGLYPLILEKSFQAQFLIPMAIALAFGVLVGTGFILIFFPVLLLTYNDIKVKILNFINSLKDEKIEKLSPEDVEVAVLYSRRTLDN
ncbi:MAG: efflux RND transporter permease subunit [Melioribacteraceae bacterium]|nr:efflux RND transporter permease subunit [Melioribacteraceae bacterium]